MKSIDVIGWPSDQYRRAVRRAAIQRVLGIVVACMVVCGLVSAAWWAVSRQNACERKGGAWVQGQCLDIKTIEVP